MQFEQSLNKSNLRNMRLNANLQGIESSLSPKKSDILHTERNNTKLTEIQMMLENLKSFKQEHLLK